MPGTAFVVGGDSAIGGAVVDRLKAGGLPVAATSRRTAALSDGRYFLDLKELPLDWAPPAGIQTALISAGVTSLATCRRAPEESARVNVENTLRVAEALVSEEIFVLFLSTNLVFDGTRAQMTPDDPPSPTTVYGRQKAETERRLLALPGDVAVLRLTKVLSPRMDLFAQWVASLNSGETIRPFSDLVCAPIPLALVTEAIIRLLGLRRRGVFHLSANRNISYADIARRIALRLGVPEDRVDPTTAAEAGVSLETTPAHSTLDMGGLAAALSLAVPDAWEAVDHALGLEQRSPA